MAGLNAAQSGGSESQKAESQHYARVRGLLPHKALSFFVRAHAMGIESDCSKACVEQVPPFVILARVFREICG